MPRSLDPQVNLAELVLRERKRFKRGHKAEFAEWCGKELGLSMSRVDKLLAVARSPDPETAMAKLRDDAAERNRRHREKLRKLVTWARKQKARAS